MYKLHGLYASTQRFQKITAHFQNPFPKLKVSFGLLKVIFWLTGLLLPSDHTSWESPNSSPCNRNLIVLCSSIKMWHVDKSWVGFLPFLRSPPFIQHQIFPHLVLFNRVSPVWVRFYCDRFPYAAALPFPAWLTWLRPGPAPSFRYPVTRRGRASNTV